jgi:hypothetical protein
LLAESCACIVFFRGVRAAASSPARFFAQARPLARTSKGKAAQSRAEFIAKVRISLKEAREALYWLRLIESSEIIAAPRIHPLITEADEIVAILTTIVKKASSKPAHS